MAALIVAAALWAGGGGDWGNAGWEAAWRAVRAPRAPAEMDWPAYYRRHRPLAPGQIPCAACSGPCVFPPIPWSLPGDLGRPCENGEQKSEPARR